MQNDKHDVEAPNLSEDELYFRSKILRELEKARTQRENSHAEFDDQTFSEYWESNAKAANSYIPPKINEFDVRTTTGTTKEKGNTVLSSLINFNLEPIIKGFDQDNVEVYELGLTMQDLIKKSRKIESPEYDVKKVLIYHELLSQGTVFVEDTQVEFRLPNKIAKDFEMIDGKFSDFDWKEGVDKVYKYCSASLINNLNVYLGNIREFDLEKQPYVAVRKLLTRAEAQSKYGKWGRWENVPRKVTKIAGDSEDGLSYNRWSLEPLEDGMVEEVKYYNKWSNDFMILLNGVPMFPVKRSKKGVLGTFPLSSLLGVCEYPLAKGDIEPISQFFAYSKSIPAKTKVDQQIFDEMLKAIILKTRKSYQPPMANNTGKTLSKKIFYPGTIHNGVNPDKLQEIGNNIGVTPSEYNATEFIKRIIDSKSVSPVLEGQSVTGQQTAREIIESKQQSMLKLGITILGVINLEKRLAKLRLYNILKYWTEPIDKRVETTKEGVEAMVNVYRTESIDSEFEDGRTGEKIVDFREGPFPTGEQILAEEEILEAVRGRPVSKVYLDPQELRAIDYRWSIEINPTEKNTSSLKLAQFDEYIQKLLAMFVPLGKMPNIDYLAERQAILQGEDPRKIWPAQAPPVPALPPEATGQTDLQNQLAPPSPKNSVSQLLTA
jgi:hypothetical protein